MNRWVWSGIALGARLAAPSAGQAQDAALKEFQVGDAGQMAEKFIGLANAFDGTDYDWRPMEGVRSVRGVLGLMIAEAYLFPRMWGVSPPEGVETNFNALVEEASGFEKARMVAELEEAFEYFQGVLSGMNAEVRSAEGRTFGRSMPNHVGITMAMSDMHEHLGQLIAYARANEVVPPWSRGGTMGN